MIKSKKFNITEYKNNGLSSQEAQKKLINSGENKVVGKKPPNDFYFLFKQFQNPLVLVLLIAIFITVVMNELTDAFVIALAVIINTALGFIQERKAFKSLESLKKVVSHQAYVIRNGEKQQVSISSIVPGDIVVVYEGDKIPADGLVIENSDLLVEEALLTGESIPVEKQTITIPKNITTIEEALAKNSLQLSKVKHEYKVFMGTIVTGGVAKILITQTGMATQLGSIAAHIEENRETKTPLEKKLDTLARFITFGIILLSIGIFLVGIATNRDFVEMFTIAVAISVAAIPEGLVVGLTAILAIGMHKILKRKGLVRTLVAAETLGSVTTVCVDKTGTLTEGRMKVSKIATENEKLLYKTSTLANDRKDPIEIARWNWAQQYSRENKKVLSPEKLHAKYVRTAEIPFSVERRFLAVQSGKEIFLSGAPEEMLNRSNVNKKEKEKYLSLINAWASEGKRLIGYGYIAEKDTHTATNTFKKLKKDNLTKKITWLGITGFDDPIRSSVKNAIKKTQNAGIQFKVITGDYSSTALSVIKQIGLKISNKEVLEGTDVEPMSTQELQEKVESTILFARTKPSHKLKIVNALKQNGHIVAMMGDGINDAPALATSDIGIVVEDASEVAKESSDLILLDSNMNTIVAAIEEGRAMFDNLRKVALYLLSDSFAELIIVFVSLLLGWPLAISAAQILWINLINDGLPNLALTIDPKAKNILKRKPLSPSEKLLNSEMLVLIFLISITAATSGLLIFSYFLNTKGIEFARTMVFVNLSIDSLIYVYSCRSLDKNIWHDSLFNNKPLLGATAFGVILTILSVYLEPLQKLLKTVPLAMNDWLIVLFTSILVIMVIELTKWIWNYLYKGK